MSRPLYETPDHLRNEATVVMKLQGAWKCTLTKLPRSYRLDHVIYRNSQIVAAVEIKCRKIKMNQYPTIMISLSKRMEAAWWHSVNKVPTFFVVQFTDALAYVDLTEEPCSVQQGGRVDRNDPADTEPMAHYSISRMKVL